MSNFQLYSASINLSSCRATGALWSSSSQLPGVSSSSLLLTIWGLALSRLPPYGARYPTPTGCPNAGSHLLYHKILILSAPLGGKVVQLCFYGSEAAEKEGEEINLQRHFYFEALRPWALTKQVLFSSTQSKPHNIQWNPESPLPPLAERPFSHLAFWG